MGVNNLKYMKISQSDAKLQLNSDKNIILLDVRTQEEYDEQHIPNSILIPVDNIMNFAETEISDKSSKILVYCRTGKRSEIAAKALISLGYMNVYDMGGIVDWQYEIE